MDGIPDHCDADTDNDLVDDDEDNCPRGDGDAVYDETRDGNPDQRDSGGVGLGDLCDPVCRGPGSPVLETAQLRDRPAGPPSLGARLNG